MTAWVLTIPVSGLLAAVFYLIMSFFWDECISRVVAGHFSLKYGC